MKALVLRVHQLEMKVLEWLRSPLLLLIRLAWGWQFFVAGKGKLSHLDLATENFTRFGLPMPRLNAVMAGTTETVCGLCLMLGLGGRVATIPLVFTMLVAYATAHRSAFGEAWTAADPDPILSALPFSFLIASLVVLVFGSGALSLDHILWKVLGPKEEPKK